MLDLCFCFSSDETGGLCIAPTAHPPSPRHTHTHTLLLPVFSIIAKGCFSSPMLSRHPCHPHSLFSSLSPVPPSLPSSSPPHPLTPSPLHTTAASVLWRKNDACPKQLISLSFHLLLLLHSASFCALTSPPLSTSYAHQHHHLNIPSPLLFLPLSTFEACTTLHSGRQAEDSCDGRFLVCQACTCEGPRLLLSSRLTDMLMVP